MSSSALASDPGANHRTPNTDSRAKRVFCFSILAAAEPGVMPRVLQLFAKRGLVPMRWHSDVVVRERVELHIDLQLDGLSEDLAAYIARCLRQVQCVEAVLTSEKRLA